MITPKGVQDHGGGPGDSLEDMAMQGSQGVGDSPSLGVVGYTDTLGDLAMQKGPEG